MRYVFIIIVCLMNLSVKAESFQDAFLSSKNPYISDLKSNHQAAIKLINNGDYSSAWSKMLPLAKEGDEHAMYILGKMIIVTPSLHHKLDLAERLLTQASKQNHVLAKQALKELKGIRSIDDIQQHYVKSFKIDDKAKSSLHIAKKEAAARKHQVPMFDFLFFINEISPKFNSLMPIASQLEQRIGPRANVKYVLVTTNKDFSDNRLNQRVDRFEFPKGGVGIDPDGAMAKQYGITSYPTVVAIHKGKGTYKVVKVVNLDSTIQSLFQFYRTQAK